MSVVVMGKPTPIYECIKQDLRDRIDSGELAEGASVPSEYQLAEQLAVSRHQTRQALRELELEGYILRSQGRRSVVAPASRRARAVSVPGPGTVAVALQQLDTTHVRRIFEGFVAQAALHDVQYVLYSLRFEPEEELDFLRRVHGAGFAGLIAWIHNDRVEIRRSLEACLGSHFPVVLVDRFLPGLETDYVVTDNEMIGYRLTQHLIQRGHERIGFIGTHDGASSGALRFQGYRRALREAGLGFHQGFFGHIHTDYVAAADTVKSIMSFKSAPTAFVCIHDLFVRQLVEALKQIEYRIPEDIELAMVGDERNAVAIGVPAFTLCQPSFEIGYQATEILLRRIEGMDTAAEQRRLAPVAALASGRDRELSGAMSGRPIWRDHSKTASKP